MRSTRAASAARMAGRSPTAAMASNWRPRSIVDRFGDAVELDRDGVIAPGIFEHVAAVGGQREVEPEPPRGIGEHADLVAGGRRKKKQMRH